MNLVYGCCLFRLGLAGAMCFLAMLFCGPPAWAGGCGDLVLAPEDHAYHIYPIHHGVCPEDGAPIRCHKYHWHWVCRKGDTLYWDRRLDTAARAACGCPPLPGVAPATPAVSGPPHEGLIRSDGR
ncbi:MAG: hypothetical protein AB1896_13845 [Thermodesulfobacteriota bacterium]